MDGGQQPGEVRRVVGEVAVHLHHVAGPVGQRVAEAGDVGGSDAGLLAAVQDRHPVVLGRQLVGQLAGAVG